MVEKKRILESAIGTFTTLGIKRVSIDDICLNLSISKKTFYQHYGEKQTLINDFLEAEFEKIFDEHARLQAAMKSPLEVMIRYNQFLMDQVRLKNPSVLYDLKQFYPENYAVYNQHRRKLVGTLVEILEAGIQSNDFRKQLDPRSLAEMRVSQLESILLPHPIGHDRPEEYHQQLFEHFIYGIAGFAGMGKLPDSNK